MLRGIRNSSDLQFEFQVALTNRVVAGVETVFIMTSSEFAFTSSPDQADRGHGRGRVGPGAANRGPADAGKAPWSPPPRTRT